MIAFTTLFSTLLTFAVITQGRIALAEQSDDEATVSPRIVSRLGWDAREPKSVTNFQNLPDFVVICHTATPSCRALASCSAEVRSMQNYHMDAKHWDDIAYNFIIGEDGAVYEGRGWDHVGSHSTDYNAKSIAIAFIGNFRNRAPDQIALDAAQKLIKYGVSKGKITQEYKLVGHRQVIPTISPGDKLFDEIKTWPHWTTSSLIEN